MLTGVTMVTIGLIYRLGILYPGPPPSDKKALSSRSDRENFGNRRVVTVSNLFIFFHFLCIYKKQIEMAVKGKLMAMFVQHILI
jgi:hypothetical protein